MSSSTAYKAASGIFVSHYRQILIWPLLLKLPPKVGQPSTQFDTVRQQLDQSKFWTERPSLPPCPPEADVPGGPWGQGIGGNDPNYEEIIYFHPFVRDFLYGDGCRANADNKAVDVRPLIRFERQDIAAMELRARDSSGTALPGVRFDVPRIELYLCKPLVAILAVELVWQAPKDSRDGSVTLKDVLRWQSQLREIYPPYFAGPTAGNCPAIMTWLQTRDKSEPARLESDFTAGRPHFAEFVHRGGEPPVSSHWKSILEPLLPYESSRQAQGVRYQQIVDDRMPGMTYLAVDDPRAISPGDMARLAYCDSPGEAPLAYSEEFLTSKLKACSYDRYWRETADHDVAGELTLDTRYLCSGYQFVALGSSNNWFFTHLVPSHFRRHYFRLGLLAHYQRAALLKFADELSEGIKRTSGQSPRQELADPEFRKNVSAMQMTFLKFKSRGWFTEVSNQLQGQEMYEWWTQQLKLEELFRHVDETSESLYSALTEYENRRLTKVATFGVPVSLAMAFVAWFLDTPEQLIRFWTKADVGMIYNWLIVIGIAVGFAGIWWAFRCLRIRRISFSPDDADW